MLAEQTDFVIGVDTHRDRHSAAILASSGGLVDETSASADQGGYSMLLRWAQCYAAGRRVWAIEGSGSYGAGLAAFLNQRGERVVEIGRRVRRNGPPAPKAILSTRSRLHARRSASDNTLHRELQASVRHCASSSTHVRARCLPAPPRSTNYALIVAA